jgi:hypothetical protein
LGQERSDIRTSNNPHAICKCHQWWYRTKSGGSQEAKFEPVSGRELTPFSQGSGSILLEFFAAIKVALLVKVIVYGRLDGGELRKLRIDLNRVMIFSSRRSG